MSIFFEFYHQVGGEVQFEAILKSIHQRTFDTDLCDYITYGKVITLILSSHYYTVSQLELLYQDVRRLIKIPNHSSKLHLTNIDFCKCIHKKPFDEHMRLPILEAILRDLFTHTAATLAGVMEEKKCLTGDGITNIYSSFFCLPVSQYIAVCRKDTVELWACDPKVDGLIKNICHSYAYHTKNGRLEDNPHLEPV